jgi:SAM-dependent methyltransferase
MMDILPLLACPKCGGGLSPSESDLTCTACRARHPVIRSVPRFVALENYAANFGFQWNRFSGTQLDSRTGVAISRDRFIGESGWTERELRGKLVLDIGCGAGRFAEVALSLGANVVALDYSAAVDACLSNLGASPRLAVVQGDIYSLPFKPGAFDFIYCFGVLQHTPEPQRAFAAIPRFLKAGGRLAIDVYPKLWRNLLWTKYWLRPITKRIKGDTLFRSIERTLPVLMPISLALGRVPKVGRWLRYMVPVANYEGRFPLSRKQLAEWALLDTFDMLAPAHDHPQTQEAVLSWFEAAGFKDVEVFRRGFVIGRGVKPRMSSALEMSRARVEESAAAEKN